MNKIKRFINTSPIATHIAFGLGIASLTLIAIGITSQPINWHLFAAGIACTVTLVIETETKIRGTTDNK